jgi:putative spermidine/putrescine transport system permease protein
MAWLRRSGTVEAGAWLVLTYLIAPSLVVFPLSLTDRPYLALPQDGLSLAPWRQLLSPQWLGAAGESLVIAMTAMALAVLLGTLCAIGCSQLASRAGEAVRAAMLLPLVVPTIVYALGLYRLFIDLHLLGMFAGIVIAHAVTALPYVVITVSAALANFDRRLEQAARGLGASPLQTLRMVVLPEIMPGMVTGAIFAFVHSWDELVMVLFIAGRRITTLPRLMWDRVHESLDPATAAVAAALTLFTVLLLLPLLRRRVRQAASEI